MLVLTRKPNQEIVINDCIRIRVGELRGNRVRLLINAPPEVKICRQQAPRPAEDLVEAGVPSALCASDVS